MPTVSGNLLFVSSRAAQVSEVWLHAREVRTHTTGVVTTGNDRFPVEDGQVEFTCLPGPAVLALISQGRAVDTIPIVVGESEAQSLRNVVRAAQIVDDSTQREIERLSAEMMEALDSAREHDESAAEFAAESKSSAGKAGGAASAAELSAGEAKSSASVAEGHASRAQSSAEESGRAADRAEGARSEARAAWDGAKEARDAAEGHASTAEGHATAAASSAGDAQGAAGRADESAQQVREIAESTSWDGDQVTVNGKQSPHLTGPQGERGLQGPPGTVEGIDFSQYVTADDFQNADLIPRSEFTEALSDVVREGTEANLSGIFLDNGAEDATGIVFQNRGAESYLRFSADNHLTLTNIDGDAERVVSMPDQWDFNTHVDMRNNQLRGLPAPSGDNHAATKSYVDGKAEGKQDKAKVLDRLAQYTEDGGTITPTVGASGAFVFPKCVVVTDNDGWVKAAGEPEDDWHVANKQYVDEQVSAVRDRVGALESGGGGGGFWAGTQAAYNRESKDSNTLYVITG